MDLTSIAGVRLNVKGEAGSNTVNFDVKAKFEERERKSQLIVVNFSLLLTTRPGLVRFEVEGVVTLTGKESEMDKMLEADPKTKVPYIFHKVYQHAFTAMYLLSTILNAPPPPHDLLSSEEESISAEGITVETETSGAVAEKPVEGGGQQPKA